LTAAWASTAARAIGIALFVVTVLLASRARAESAKTFFDAGVRQYNLGHFQEAIAEFEKAYNVDPAPILLFNIAQSHRQLGDKERALFFYRRYLEQAPNAANKGEVEQRMKDLSASLQQERELKQKPPPGVETKEVAPANPPPITPASNPVPPDNVPKVEGTPPPPEPAVRPWLLEASLAPAFVTFSGRAIDTPVMLSFRVGAGYTLLSGASNLRLGVDAQVAILPYTNTVSAAKESSSLWGFMLGARYLYRVTQELGLGADLGVGVIWWDGLGAGNPFTVDQVAASGPVPMPSLQVGLRAEYALSPGFFLALSPELLWSKTTSDGLTMSVSSVRRIDIYAGAGYRF
jgi:hypothetical protein